jgi:hypothetical protein
MDGKMARARRENDEEFQHNSVSTKNGEERMRGRGSFYTSRGQRKWLGSMPSVSLREIEQISRKGHTI